MSPDAVFGDSPARPLPSVRFSFFAQKRLCLPLFLPQISKLSRPPARLSVWRCFRLFSACLEFLLSYALCRPSVFAYLRACRPLLFSVRPSVRFSAVLRLFTLFLSFFVKIFSTLWQVSVAVLKKTLQKSAKFFVKSIAH